MMHCSRFMPRLVVIVGFLTVLTLLGCNTKSDSTTVETDSNTSADTDELAANNAASATDLDRAHDEETAVSNSADDSSAAALPAVNVTVQAADQKEFERLLARHRGKVVLVDFWATWCIPCMEQFGHTVALHQKYGGSGLQVMTLSCDKPEDEAKVLKFLRKQRADTENYLTRADINGTFEQFNIRGGIPFYKLYDRQGQLRYEFNGDPLPDEGTQPIEHLEVRLKELLAEGESESAGSLTGQSQEP